MHLCSSGAFEHCRDSFGQYFKVQKQRPVVDVFHVELHPLLEGNVGAAVDLPEAGDARADGEAASMPVFVKAFVIPFGEGSGADKAHISFEDVYELGELIQAGFAEEFSDFGDAGIVVDLEDRALGFVEGFEFSLFLLCSLDHGPEFAEAESPFVEADAVLGEKDRSWRGELDEEGYEGKKGCR